MYLEGLTGGSVFQQSDSKWSLLLSVLVLVTDQLITIQYTEVKTPLLSDAWWSFDMDLYVNVWFRLFRILHSKVRSRTVIIFPLWTRWFKMSTEKQDFRFLKTLQLIFSRPFQTVMLQFSLLFTVCRHQTDYHQLLFLVMLVSSLLMQHYIWIILLSVLCHYLPMW